MADSRYRITDRIATGGMAEVFKGVAESLQGFRKHIAIKRILPALTQNKKFVAMFLDEARLSLTLQHANVVQVFDIGHSDDTYFIVMEYVDGVDLKGFIEWRRRLGRRLPVSASLYITNEICKGLAYAHDLVNPETGRPFGIVHRDISPPNVLISKQGEVKVVDFGLAKAHSQLESTDPGVVKGKMSYLSPEAARGEEVDSRADIFSLGILLYELLTGKRLFYGESDYQTVELVRNARIPPIRAQNPEVERELEDIVRKTLARNKDDRYQHASDLQDALAHYSYSRGLKVIARDIAELVRQCLEDRSAQSSGGRKPGNILDALLQDEINKFTSVGLEQPGARPLSADELSSTSDLIDPRGWAIEAGTSGPTHRPTGSLPLPAQTGGKSGGDSRRSGDHRRPGDTRRTGEMRATSDTRPTLKDDIAAVLSSGIRQTGSQPIAPEDVFGGPTPGPEALASVLEPTPEEAAAQAAAQAAAIPTLKKKSPMGIVVAVIIGLVVIGAVATAVLVKR